jgi:hypothetical protein
LRRRFLVIAGRVADAHAVAHTDRDAHADPIAQR